MRLIRKREIITGMNPREAQDPSSAAEQRGIYPTTSTPVPFSLRRRGRGMRCID
jgi:hypothetical protein